jgi:phosphopantetheine--protein transferase-like protein
VIAIGIDTVEIDRFALWHTYSRKKLSRIYSDQEQGYCLANPHKTTERFAARFAAREAFLKALHQLSPTITIPLLTVCKNISVEHQPNGAPLLIVDWAALHCYAPILCTMTIQTQLSISHTASSATALVLLQILVSE